MHRGDLTVIGFFSIGTPYEVEARTLIASLDKVGMKHQVQGFADRGDWYANTAAKAEHVHEARHTMTGPLLYVDVDAFVHQNCTAYFLILANQGYDFGVHWFAGPSKGRKTRDVCRCVRGLRCNRGHRLLSGTLFLGDTKGARNLVDRWIAKNAALRAQGIMDGGGQKNLWRVVVEMEAERSLNMSKLPGRYCYVGDKAFSYPRGEPKIIEHLIASRENRDIAGRVNPWRRGRITELLKLVEVRP